MFTSDLPSFTAPTINNALGLSVNGQYGAQNIFLQSGKTYTAYIDASDTNTPAWPLNYQWMVLPIPSVGPTDHSTYAPLDASGASWSATGVWPILSQDGGGGCVFTAPTAAGQYRLSVWVYNLDASGNPYKYAYHNAPFSVSSAPSQYYYGVTADTYVQGPSSTGGGAAIQASAALNFGSATLLQANSFASTKSVNYFPFLNFDLSTAAFAPSAANLPTQVSLNVFAISGQDPYFNLSVYPVYLPTTWSESTLSFATLQPGLTTVAQWPATTYNWPYSNGYGGQGATSASVCTLLTPTPAAVTACAPLVRRCVRHACAARTPPDASPHARDRRRQRSLAAPPATSRWTSLPTSSRS
jgi:hypothetical protein